MNKTKQDKKIDVKINDSRVNITTKKVLSGEDSAKISWVGPL